MIEEKKVLNAYKRLINKYKNYSIKEDINYVLIDKIKTDYYFFKFIPKGLRNKKVLDVGTFFPFDPIYWAEVVKEFHCIDINQDVVDFSNLIMKEILSESLLKKITYRKASGTDIPYEDNYFDIVLSFSTIDHISGKANRDKTFKEIARVTKSKGFVIITLPNKLDLFSYRKSMKLQKQGRCKLGIEVFYTPNELKKILIENNLKPIYFCSSAGDKGGSLPYISYVYNTLVSKFGSRMGWLAQKI